MMIIIIYRIFTKNEIYCKIINFFYMKICFCIFFAKKVKEKNFSSNFFLIVQYIQ